MQSTKLSIAVVFTAAIIFATAGAKSASSQIVDVSLPAVVDQVGETIQIPVLVDDLTGKGIATFYLEIAYDSDILDVHRSVIANTLSDVDGAGKFDGTNTPGEFTVAYAAPATRPLSGEGTLILLEAEVLSEGTTDLSFVEMQFNDDTVPSTTYNGLFSTDALSFADLSASLEASSDLVIVGESFTVTASVLNHGADAAADVESVISLPEGVAFQSATNGCVHSDGAVTCENSSLSQSGSVDHTLTLTAPSTSQVLEISTVASATSVDSDLTDNSATIIVNVESDLDGISDAIEEDVPNLNGSGTGDGNGDGIADSEQENVASLPNATDGSYITVAAPDGASLSNVSVSEPETGVLPPSVQLPDGVLSFELDVEVEGAVVVTIYSTNESNTYLKYGPTPDTPNDHWYEFTFDGTTGAQVFSDRVELHFVDGQRGDADLVADGTIVDPGSIAYSTNQAPVAEDDAYETDEDQPLVVAQAEGVLANDSDPNADPLNVYLITDAERGSLDLNADGRFTYTPEENFEGSDSFTYEVTDGLMTDAATVTISVNDINDPPSEALIESPGAGQTVMVGGETRSTPSDGEEELFSVTWTDATDPEGDAVYYTLEVGEDAGFSNAIAEFDVTGENELTVTVAQAADWFDSAAESVDLGSEVTIYLRVVTSDGSAERKGDASSLVLIRGSITSTGHEETPDQFSLQGNYPNPFNPSTNVLFDVPQAANVSIDVFDSLGRRVFRVPAQPISAGAGRSITIDGSNLPSGAYVYRVVAEMGTFTEISAGVMTLMK